MKQILQDMANGQSSLCTAPVPMVTDNKLLIAGRCSLISSGTERMLVNFGKASYFAKARQQPEKVKMVLEKIKTDGLLSTIDAVRSKLAQPLPLGYCHVGVVAEIGGKTRGFKVGDRVVSNGPHADMVSVANNLCAHIPDNVDDESAAFTVVASIGLQGIRLAQPTLGEHFVVMGAGLIGLLTIQLLKAHGCRVLAMDFDEAKLALAQQFGAETLKLSDIADPVAAGQAFSRGHGVDGVIITASTASNDPVAQAARMTRQRGRIILVGVTGLSLNRADFYAKELTFQVSCSYGPGRYDPAYEADNLDYPIGFVRWTAQRNFEAVLDLMANGQLNVQPLITHRFLFEAAESAYELLTEDVSALGILLRYASSDHERAIRTVHLEEGRLHDPAKPILAVMGAGNYAARTLLPAFKRAGAQFDTLLTANGVNAVIQGHKVGFLKASTDSDVMFADKTINTVVIATRHDSHANFVVQALNAHKHVFVEKPLAINLEQLSAVEAAYHASALSDSPRLIMVGFNRRFAPHIQKMKHLLAGSSAPISVMMTINAGAIAIDHWTRDLDIGGGRMIGEGCHFIDLMRFLVGHSITSVDVKRPGGAADVMVSDESAILTLGFADGSMGSIHYLTNGAAQFPKERIEVFTAGRILQLDNFRVLRGFGWRGFKKMALWRQDKGQQYCCQAFLAAIEQGSSSPIPIEEIFEVARVSIEVGKQIASSST